MTLGQRIQQIRLEHGLSQEKFAEKLGTTRQTVSRWELDQAYPELAKIVLISRVFLVSVDSIVKDGISTFDARTDAFVCGVYRSAVAEIVETERFALVFYCLPKQEILGTKLYKGYENNKRLVAVCEHILPEHKTEYAYGIDESDAECAVFNSERLKDMLGDVYDARSRDVMRRTESFVVDHSGAPLPTVSEVGIAECLVRWRMGDRYHAARDGFEFSLCTGKTEYIFFIRPADADIYCGASYNVVFALGLFGAGQFFRIRNYKENSAPYCAFYYDFSYELAPTRIPTDRCDMGKCIETEQGYLWCVKRYTDDEIVLQGCGEDEYIYRRSNTRAERFVLI